MPLYEYRCLKCGRLQEKIQKFSDPPLKTCQGCGGRLERMVSAPSLQFKGSGWYITDYARKPAASEGAKGPGADKGESKSDGSGGKTEKPGEASTAKKPSESKLPSKK